MNRILITGGGGQLGQVLSVALAGAYGTDNIIVTDLNPVPSWLGKYEMLNVLDKARLETLVKQHEITQIYHLAAILSATGEKNPQLTWQVNMEGYLNVLEAARALPQIEKIFFPSSIAVFGAGIDLTMAGQDIPLIPATVYGISKAAGENWSKYYFDRYGVDVRSIRYPGIIGYQSPPGGGTTDYAVEIYHYAVRNEAFSCFLEKDTRLPMIYMEDAIRATLELMSADASDITVRTSYNLNGMDFTPAEIASSIQQLMPDFKITYNPDERQKIAASWPQRIDDQAARKDWQWQPKYDLASMTKDMLKNLQGR
jgi:nucleoside-diphosphate-sugar epimerase